jgi:SAM-dependent methyltransferase
LDKNTEILEIGCNVGRSLNYLYKKGFHNLTGIEIGPKAIELMKETFPEVYKTSTIIIGDAAEEVRKLETKKYDLVFCHSVLVNIHPSCNYIFKEMGRVSKRFILILENEGSYTAYPRDFKKLFEKEKYRMIIYKMYRRSCGSLAEPFEFQDYFINNTIRLFVKDHTR